MNYSRIMFAGFLFIMLVILPSVSALTSTVTIQTKNPVHGLIIYVYSTSGEYVEKFYATTDASGKAVTNYTTTLSTMMFSVMVVKEGVVKDNRNFTVTASPSISLSFFDQPVENLVPVMTSNATTNVSTQNQTTHVQTNEPQTDTQTITGKVTGTASSSSDILWYVLAGLAVFAVAGFFVSRYVRSSRTTSSRPIPPSQKEILKNQKSSPSPTMEASLRQAQIKVKQAQEELDKISRVREAEQRLQDAQRDLERAKKGF